MQQKLWIQILYIGLPEFLGRLLYTYLHPQLGVDKVSGWSWQLITAICDEDDELTVSELLSEDCEEFYCCVDIPTVVVVISLQSHGNVELVHEVQQKSHEDKCGILENRLWR